MPVKSHTFLSSVAVPLLSNIFLGYVIRWLSGPVWTWQRVNSPEQRAIGRFQRGWLFPDVLTSRAEILTVGFSGTEFYDPFRNYGAPLSRIT